MATQRRELRRAKRNPTRQAAWIDYDGAPSPVACVLWDLSDCGARISAAHAKNLPADFTLFLGRDRKTMRHCQIVWRNDGHLGVKFVPAAEANNDLRRRTAQSAVAATASVFAGAFAPADIDVLRRELTSTMGGAGGAVPVERRRLAFSSLAGGLLIVFVAATLVFYAASVQAGYDAPWALQLCDSARSFCDHPKFGAVAGALMTVVYLAVRGMEV